MKRPLTVEDKILLLIAAVLIILLILFLSGCAASQGRAIKFHYEYRTACILTVSGTETQTGDEIAAGADLKGVGCDVERDATAAKHKQKKGPEPEG